MHFLLCSIPSQDLFWGIRLCGGGSVLRCFGFQVGWESLEEKGFDPEVLAQLLAVCWAV